MSQELAATSFLMEKLNAIECRLESIERMLGEEKTSSPSEYKAIWHGEVEQEPLWRTGLPPENKMVVIKGRKGNTHFGYITKQGFYNIFVMDGSVIKEVTRPSSLFEQWREMTKEENTLCWERGILGASEEHAELSKLELPMAKQEPEWRPMSTAPTNGELILARTFRGMWIYVSFDFSALECHWRDTDNNGWSYEDLTGWRPL